MSYLQQLLKDQMLSPAEVSALEAHREEVENYLRKEFGAEPVIRYGGSKAKNTMVKECYDLDIICYFPGTNQDSLAEIRKKVFTHLDKEYKLKDKTTAIRILDLKHPVHPAEYHIDVVPGCFVDGKSGDANLPLTKGDKKCLKTNIDKHVEAVSKSDCREIIKLGKIWAKRHGIDFRTFVMENFIIDKLAGFQGKDNLEKSFAYVLNALSNDFLGAKIVDPANPTGNIISESMDTLTKSTIAARAKADSKLIEGSGNNDSTWKIIFAGGISSAMASPSSSTVSHPVAPQTPWANDNYRN
jgi:hypothetical protein